MISEITRMKTTARKAEERKRRRQAGFRLAQVWVHDLDREMFAEFVADLPHEERYAARPVCPPKALKMPGT